MSEPTEIPLAEGSAAVAAIEAQRAAAVDAVTAGIYERLGERLEPFGDAGRAYCREDLHSHLDYLVGTLVAGTPTPFAEYLAWLRDVLEARGVPADSVELSVTLLDEFYRERLEAPALAPVEAALRGGHDALTTAASAEAFRAPVAVADEHPSAEALAEHLVTGDQAGARALVTTVAAERGYVGMAVGLLQPALYRIGERWQRREISVAQEHLATAFAQRLLVQQFTQAAMAPPDGPKALFACVPGNHHALGLRIVGDTFELEGWSVEFLGADTPADDLVDRIGATRPNLVGLSVSMVRQLPQLKEIVERIRERFGAAAPLIIAGGIGLARVPQVAERLGLDACYPTAVAAIEAQQ